jgi:hypothetical protein
MIQNAAVAGYASAAAFFRYSAQRFFCAAAILFLAAALSCRFRAGFA